MSSYLMFLIGISDFTVTLWFILFIMLSLLAWLKFSTKLKLFKFETYENLLEDRLLFIYGKVIFNFYLNFYSNFTKI
jgi:hypothetical protein